VVERLPDTPGARATLERWAVHIEPVPEGGYRGWVASEAATASERRVQGRTCREVFDALVLIAALSLEEAEEGSPATAGDSLASIVVPPEPAYPEAGPADDVRGAGDQGEPHLDGVSVGALGFAQLQTGVAPATALDVGAALVVAWRAAGFEPWLLLGFYAGSAPQALRVETATARFEHWSTRALGCPWRFPREGPAALRPCLGLDVGRVRGEGARVAGAATRNAPWLSGLAELRLDLEVLAGVSLGISGGAVVPFVRPRFYFEPGVVAYHAAPVGFAASSFAALLF